MSGICAVWNTTRPGGTGATLAAVTRGLSLAPEERVEYRTGPSAGVGVSARFATQQIYESSRLQIVCDADLDNESELLALADGVGTMPPPSGAGTAALLAALYERFGRGFVEKLRGGFSVILWDLRDRKLL